MARKFTTLTLSALMAVACNHDVNTPTTSTLTPSEASRALAGAHDKTYTFTIDATKDSPHLTFGSSYITIPANSICDLGTSGYGASYWDAPCVPQTGKVTLTVTVYNSATDNPSVEFQPAMRFNPANNVTLFLAVTNAATLSNMTVMKYCSTGTPTLGNSSCIDESLTDSSLKTNIDTSNKTVWRRIKHFSGYLIAE